MPTYEYVCTECGRHLEVAQSFSDAALTTCPHCDGALRKVFGSIGIVLKGSGFYKTDSRAATSKAGGRGDKDTATSTKADDSKGDTKRGDAGSSSGSASATETSSQSTSGESGRSGAGTGSTAPSAAKSASG